MGTIRLHLAQKTDLDSELESMRKDLPTMPKIEGFEVDKTDLQIEQFQIDIEPFDIELPYEPGADNSGHPPKK